MSAGLYMLFGQIGLLVLEAMLVASLLLLLFHRRRDWGLTPLFVAMGVFQHMQVVLAAFVYVEVAPDLFVSPGSVVLFTSTLFAVLLVYIYEDAIETRKLIYALVLANISLAILSYAAGLHVEGVYETTSARFVLTREFFAHDLRIMTIGTVCLFVDTILLIVIYEAIGYRRLGSFLRILFTVTSVLCLDQVLFTTGAFYDADDYSTKLGSGLIGKCASGLLYSTILWGYLRLRGREPAQRAPGFAWDVFQLLSYRQKFDLLGAEYDVLEERVQQRTVELREANAELQEMSRQLVNAQETERRSLARELHDEIGQLLTAIKMQMQSARTDASPESRANLNSAVATIDETINQVRSLSLRLRPSILDDLGLRPALEWQAEQLTERTNIRVQIEGDLPDARLPTELETVFFRVAQEAMTNIMRHAQAKSVSVELSCSGAETTMSVCDDGVGFDPTTITTKRTGGLGLPGMRERVELVGGTLKVESSPGKGTRVFLSCPNRVLAGSQS